MDDKRTDSNTERCVFCKAVITDGVYYILPNDDMFCLGCKDDHRVTPILHFLKPIYVKTIQGRGGDSKLAIKQEDIEEEEDERKMPAVEREDIEDEDEEGDERKMPAVEQEDEEHKDEDESIVPGCLCGACSNWNEGEEEERKRKSDDVDRKLELLLKIKKRKIETSVTRVKHLLQEEASKIGIETLDFIEEIINSI